MSVWRWLSVSFVCYLLVSAPILSTCVYEDLVNKSTTSDEASSDTGSNKTKYRVSLVWIALIWKFKVFPVKIVMQSGTIMNRSFENSKSNRFNSNLLICRQMKYSLEHSTDNYQFEDKKLLTGGCWITQAWMIQISALIFSFCYFDEDKKWWRIRKEWRQYPGIPIPNKLGQAWKIALSCLSVLIHVDCLQSYCRATELQCIAM